MTRLRTDARAAVRSLKVNDGDVVLLRADSRLATKQGLETFSHAMATSGRERVVLCVVDSFDDLSVLDDEQMGQLGWIRKK